MFNILDVYYYIQYILFRTHCLQVKGKSVCGIRPVYVLIEELIVKAIDTILITHKPTSYTVSNFLFSR